MESYDWKWSESLAVIWDLLSLVVILKTFESVFHQCLSCVFFSPFRWFHHLFSNCCFRAPWPPNPWLSPASAQTPLFACQRLDRRPDFAQIQVVKSWDRPSKSRLPNVGKKTVFIVLNTDIFRICHIWKIYTLSYLLNTAFKSWVWIESISLKGE